MQDNRTLDQIINDFVEARIGEVFTCIPGKVVSWNSSIETATIQPVVKDPEGNTLPNIVGAKVCFPGVYWDLEAGETGIVFFSMLDFDTWWRTGQIEEPANLDTHDFDTAIFLPGMKRKATSRNVPSGATVLAGDDVRLGEDGASEAVIRGDEFFGAPGVGGFLEFLTQCALHTPASPTLAAAATALLGDYVPTVPLSTKVKVD